MPSCPFCLENFKPGARKCPHCQTSFDAPSSDPNTTVYVLDNGLIRFSKFVGAALALFVLVGAYLYAVDIKDASEKSSEAKLESQEALIEIEKQKADLEKKLDEIENTRQKIVDLEKEIILHRDQTQQNANQVRELVRFVESQRDRAIILVNAFPKLDQGEEVAATEAKEERGIVAARGKLWANGSTLRFHFLNGAQRDKATVRAAIDEWKQYVNLNITEVDSDDAEIRISFEEPGSWSFLGTDALGLPKDSPTLNYGTLAEQLDPNIAKQTALHEFGHVLGLTHEFQNPSAGDIFNIAAVFAYYKINSGWDKETVERNLLRTDQYAGSRVYDPFSIMNYSFPKNLLVEGKEPQPGLDLSESDRKYVASLYPRA